MSNLIKLYTASTANGIKATMLLELLGIKYELHSVDMEKNEQKQPEFLAMNPNGKIPTLVDPNTNITLGESAAILTYLADTYDKERNLSYEVGTPEYYKQLELMYFQIGSIGPMQGQDFHFLMFASEKVPYAIERYSNETKRVYEVLNEFLARNAPNSPYLVGTHMSLADIVCLGWAVYLPLLVPLSDFPLVEKWIKTMVSVPEVVKGLVTPTRSEFFPEEIVPKV